jgi:hypothetical protein
MSYIDVFNGDADGICALHQLRLAEPRPEARLVTGVKRDIRLLEKIRDVRNTDITVLDISLDRNRNALERLLAERNTVLYIDHHFSGPVPESGNLTPHIDPSPRTCTSLIVDGLLQGRHRAWAVAGAFGDNLDKAASGAADTLGLDAEAVRKLREIGILMNYNGYGASPADLYFLPDELYRQVREFEDPFAFHAESPALKTLRKGYDNDMARATEISPTRESSLGRMYTFPAEPWARRVVGVFSNKLARERPDMAHCLLIANSDTTLRISVRAPLNNRTGADELCRQFPSGGGRAAAAGINNLPCEQLEQFHSAFFNQFNPDTSG